MRRQYAPPVHDSGTYVSLSTSQAPLVSRHLAKYLPAIVILPSASVHEPVQRPSSDAIPQGS